MSGRFSDLGAERTKVFIENSRPHDGVLRNFPIEDLEATIKAARDHVVLQYANDPFQGAKVPEEELHAEIFDVATQKIIGRAVQRKELNPGENWKTFVEGTKDFEVLKQCYIQVASGWKAPDFGGPDYSAERAYAGLYAGVHSLKAGKFAGAGLSKPVEVGVFENFLDPKLSGLDRLVMVRDDEQTLRSGRGNGRKNLRDDLHFNLQYEDKDGGVSNGKGLESNQSLVAKLTTWVQKIQKAQSA